MESALASICDARARCDELRKKRHGLANYAMALFSRVDRGSYHPTDLAEMAKLTTELESLDKELEDIGQ